MNEMVRAVYDPVTLDQLRGFVAVVDEGSFSAAARKLQRVQSAVSTAMANLESQLGLRVWDRTTRIPKLTPEGEALLASTRRVLAEVDALRSVAAGMVSGLEASVSLCIDALFPLDALLDLCSLFTKEFPSVDLRLDVQLMSAVAARILDGSATLGVVTPGGVLPGLESVALSAIRMVPVVSPSHPLARVSGRIPRRRFATEIQIVLAERTPKAGAEDRAVLSPRTWRVADLHAKHMMLRAGLGWGNLPEHLVREDLAAKRLVTIRPEAWGPDEHTLHLSAIHREGTTLGPAHRWVLDALPRLCASTTTAKSTTRRRALG